eukprot:841475-Pyramimonas_sp.AAC.1
MRRFPLYPPPRSDRTLMLFVVSWPAEGLRFLKDVILYLVRLDLNHLPFTLLHVGLASPRDREIPPKAAHA